MARINLLPWRDARRKRRQRDFGILLAASLSSTLGLALLSHVYTESLISRQLARNGFLQREIGRLDEKIRTIRDIEKTKGQLIARMSVIQQLQESRPEIVHLFDELVITMPDGMVLTKIAQSGGTVTLEGRAESNGRISALMRNIEASEWLGQTQLKVIKGKEETQTGLNHFQLQLQQIKANSRQETGQSAAG